MPRLSRILVTGGSGFLGVHLCEALLDRGADEVVCVDDLSTSAPAAHTRLDGRAGYRFVRHDISEPLPMELRDKTFDTVFHLASPASPVDYLRMPTATLRTGANGTAVALDLAERCGARFVLASTSEVYGDPLEHPQTGSATGATSIPIGPRSVYDEAKRYRRGVDVRLSRRARRVDRHGADVQHLRPAHARRRRPGGARRSAVRR